MIDSNSQVASFNYIIQVPKPKKILASLYGRLFEKTRGMNLYADLELLLNKEKNAQVLFDLKNLEYLNSEGLNTLIRCLSLTRKKGGELWITQSNDSLNDLFLSTRLSDLFLTIDSTSAWMKLPKD